MNRNITEFLEIPESLRIPYFGGKIYRFISKVDNQSILKETLPLHPLNSEPRSERVTVSLTSYPARISYVHLAIRSLMLQTYKADRIVLWLAKEQFPDGRLPQTLAFLEENGLEIRWMQDLYGHKKYFFPVKNQEKNEIVITYDDDIIYPKRSIERLMRTHQKHPGCLICERGQVLSTAFLKNPGKWNVISDIGVEKPTFSMNPSPGGGCLIPYGAFHKDAVDEKKIRELAFKNDDLWYMFMCAQNGTKMIKTRKWHKLFSLIHGSQVEQMATENVTNHGNEIAMERLIKAYPIAWERICSDEDYVC